MYVLNYFSRGLEGKMNFISVISLLVWKKDQVFWSPLVVKFRTVARRESDSFVNIGTLKSGGSRQSFLV